MPAIASVRGCWRWSSGSNIRSGISHNRIHMYLKHQGAAQDDEKKQKRRKWVRYERKHSLSAGHIDWHEWDGTSIKVCVILDDASRMVLAGGECF